MRPEPKYVIELATNLEAARAEVAKLQADWDALFPDTPDEQAAPADQKIVWRTPAVAAMKPNSAIKRTLEFLDENPGKEYGAIALGLELSLPPASTRTNLAKLFKQGKVLKRGDGLYRSLNSTLEEQEETSA